MGFSYQTARQFFHDFLIHYLGTADENILREVTEKASVIAYARLIRKLRNLKEVTDTDQKSIRRCIDIITSLTEKLETLVF